MLENSLQQIQKAIDERKNIFITGGAGTGKSYILKELKNIYGQRLHITSTTGISAINIGGQTIHSWSGIGVAEVSIKKTVEQICSNPVLLNKLLSCDKLAIDEISMLDDYTFDYLNIVLKRVRSIDKPFGGIQVLLIGDFFQLPPVTYNKQSNFCFNSNTWRELKLVPFFLQKSKRQTEKSFIKLLNNIRIGKMLDLKMLYNRSIQDEKNISSKVLRIFGTNTEADLYNQKCFECVEEESFEYEAYDEFNFYDSEEEHIYFKDSNVSKDILIYRKLNNLARVPQCLKLKVGCRVMLLKNLDFETKLVNGSCGTVVHLANDIVAVLFDNGEVLSLNKEVFEYTLNNTVKVKRTQYPLRLAYGITIHKSQGMTFDKLIVDFNKIFDYGQAYVALSRTRTLDGLHIINFDPKKIFTNQSVKMFYDELKNASDDDIYAT